jgi:hypothetical protein
MQSFKRKRGSRVFLAAAQLRALISRSISSKPTSGWIALCLWNVASVSPDLRFYLRIFNSWLPLYNSCYPVYQPRKDGKLRQLCLTLQLGGGDLTHLATLTDLNSSWPYLQQLPSLKLKATDLLLLELVYLNISAYFHCTSQSAYSQIWLSRSGLAHLNPCFIATN